MKKTIEVTVRILAKVDENFEIKNPDAVFINLPLKELELMQGMPVSAIAQKVDAEFVEYETVLAEIVGEEF